MYEFLFSNPIIAMIFIAIITVIAIFLMIKAIQQMGLEKIRKYVYKLFVTAEHEFKYGDNEQKFEYVVQLARSSLPAIFRPFITEKLLKQAIQLWFDLCKDLLDDGKINKSNKEE